MKVAYYCQHVLGVGHFHRSLEICRALAVYHETCMVLGGPKVDVSEKNIDFFQLPGLEMDENFKNLQPCKPGLSLREVKKLRAQHLFDYIASFQPDIFLIELYPFGRKAFRFELDPILSGIKQGTLPPCLVFCSLRDILVEREDKQKFEKRALSTLNNYFHGLLIHADESLTPLEATFSRTNEITPPIQYTGYVTPKAPSSSRQVLRKNLGLSSSEKLLVASIGGGGVGHELLLAALHAFHKLDQQKYYFKVFTGPYTSEDTYERLCSLATKRITIERFSSNFTEWLAAADLSISMAGYNTCMNILAAGIPALLYPFAQNQEQRMRAAKLLQHKELHLLEEEDLTDSSLCALIEEYSHFQRFSTTINLEGAATTAAILSHF